MKDGKAAARCWVWVLEGSVVSVTTAEEERPEIVTPWHQETSLGDSSWGKWGGPAGGRGG